MPYDEPAAAAAPPAASPEPRWSRRDEKLLQMLVLVRNRWDHVAAHLPGRTPAQACDRYNSMVEELRRVLGEPEVATPPEWDMQVVVPAIAAPAVAEDAGEASASTATALVIVPALPAAADNNHAGPPSTPAGGGEGRPEEGQKRKKRRGGVGSRKKPEMWTEEEHSIFLVGLDKYEKKSKWKAMSEEHLLTKTPSQIASHHQKYRKRQKQRDLKACKRASIHDITVAAVIGGHEPARGAELARAELDDVGAPGEEGRGLPGEKDDHEPVAREDQLGGAEEFPGDDDLGTLFL
ncbi:hypothetical protein ACP4OV_017529 [Aristida adscensionis]